MNRLVHLMSPRRMPLVIAVACVLAVAAAMTMQQVFDYRPCPWCILQRMIFLAIALLCIVTAMSPSRRLRIVLNAFTLVLAALGISAAVYQHEVAAKSFSCNLTFADKDQRARRRVAVAGAVPGHGLGALRRPSSCSACLSSSGV